MSDKELQETGYLVAPSMSKQKATPMMLEQIDGGFVPQPRQLISVDLSVENPGALLELLSLPELSRSVAQGFVDKYGLLNLGRWYYAVDDGHLRFRRGAFRILGLPDTPMPLKETALPDIPDAEEFLETYFPYSLPKKRRLKAGDKGLDHDLIAAVYILPDREPLSLFIREVQRLHSLVDIYSAIKQEDKILLSAALAETNFLFASYPPSITESHEEIAGLTYAELIDSGKSTLAFWLNFFLEDVPIAHSHDLMRSRNPYLYSASLLELLYVVISDLVAEGKEIRRCASLPCRGYFIPRVPKQVYCQEKCSTRERVRRCRQEK